MVLNLKEVTINDLKVSIDKNAESANGHVYSFILNMLIFLSSIKLGCDISKITRHDWAVFDSHLKDVVADKLERTENLESLFNALVADMPEVENIFGVHPWRIYQSLVAGRYSNG